MPAYFNAEKLLSPELLSAVLQCIPEHGRSGAVLYFGEDYYAKRNGQVIALFRIYQDDPHFGSVSEIHEALSEQFGLTCRQICRILQGNREAGAKRKLMRRRPAILRVNKPATPKELSST
ncbi:MAG: hypothetical protein C4520_15270 [Candidatus Abyssobacteria bacterium SURF_5]|uniref:Uncharacterized protein n=1 Tax=Abyssobacteria bacterium (strain SURF_5) TaxID=2093360 RepID=A0A3A4NH39_ABYX5|nr:MAG: hypothetical protein C4520_15270 [Candidatus Abyssubacteria bacterium SURF_5]